MATSSNSDSSGLSTSTEAMRCPKCNGVMVQGFIADFQGTKFCKVSNWVEGAPGKPPGADMQHGSRHLAQICRMAPALAYLCCS